MLMYPPKYQLGIEQWLTGVRAYFEGAASELLPLFDTYAAEAVFGRRYIAEDLERLRDGAKILEVGAGSMLLSCQLAREGYEITALEPTGFGFAHFDRMREIILEQAEAHGCLPRILDSTAEALSIADHFEYAFSINVMEHVDDVELSLRKIAQSLKDGASYRFTCPNYLFPYEPHFNIPIFLTKGLTERLLLRRIHAHPTMPDASGVWKSLNWINVAGIRRISKRMQGFKFTFNTALLVATFERIASDRDFSNRRSPLVRNAILFLVRLRLHRLLRFTPAVIQPIMDCTVEKKFSEAGSR